MLSFIFGPLFGTSVSPVQELGQTIHESFQTDAKVSTFRSIITRINQATPQDIEGKFAAIKNDNDTNHTMHMNALLGLSAHTYEIMKNEEINRFRLENKTLEEAFAFIRKNRTLIINTERLYLDDSQAYEKGLLSLQSTLKREVLDCITDLAQLNLREAVAWGLVNEFENLDMAPNDQTHLNADKI